MARNFLKEVTQDHTSRVSLNAAFHHCKKGRSGPGASLNAVRMSRLVTLSANKTCNIPSNRPRACPGIPFKQSLLSPVAPLSPHIGRLPALARMGSASVLFAYHLLNAKETLGIELDADWNAWRVHEKHFGPEETIRAAKLIAPKTRCLMTVSSRSTKPAHCRQGG